MRSELGVVLESGIPHTIIPEILIARYSTTPFSTEGGVAVLESDANLIELDLLRSGARLIPLELELIVAELKCDYLVTVNQGATRQNNSMGYTLHPANLHEALPCIPVPLAGQDPDVPLD